MTYRALKESTNVLRKKFGKKESTKGEEDLIHRKRL